MRITHLAPYLQGDAGRFITDLALGQRAMGHQVTVVASRTQGGGFGNDRTPRERLDAAGITTYLADSLFVRDYAANLAVVRMLSESGGVADAPDIIHSHGAVAALIGLLFAGRRRQPIGLIHTQHSWHVAKTAEQAAADVHLLNLLDVLVAPSMHAASILRGLGVSGAHLRVIPAGVDAGQPEPDQRDRAVIDEMRRARKRGALVVACLGAIGQRRNQALLVEAVTRMRAAGGPVVHGVFAGDGEVDDLAAGIGAAGAGADLVVRGYTRAARTIAAEADLLVVPSRADGVPVEVLEAFCDRTLVAITDLPEHGELVIDGVTGCRFAEGNADALARVLTRVATMSPSERTSLVERARRKYEQAHTGQGMLDQYQAEYDRLAPFAQRPARRFLRAVR